MIKIEKLKDSKKIRAVYQVALSHVEYRGLLDYLPNFLNYGRWHECKTRRFFVNKFLKAMNQDSFHEKFVLSQKELNVFVDFLLHVEKVSHKRYYMDFIGKCDTFNMLTPSSFIEIQYPDLPRLRKD